MDFWKFNVATKEDPYPLPFTEKGVRRSGRAWDLFVFGWIFWLSPNHGHLWK
jgi:hypothetical protein